MAGLGLLDGLRDAKGAVNVAGKRRGDEHQSRLILRQRLERQCMQGCIHQAVRRAERRVQLIECRLARRQRFRIAHELEARIDGIANDIGQVIEIQGGDVFGAILQSQCAEGPVERIACAVLVVDVVIERCEARAFGQVMPRGDAMRQARITALQKSDDRRDGRAVGLEVLGERSASPPCVACGAALRLARE